MNESIVFFLRGRVLWYGMVSVALAFVACEILPPIAGGARSDIP